MQTGWSGLRIGSLLVVCAVAGFAAQAEDYPTRSVKLITQGAAASGPDVIARIVAEHLGRLWGQQVVILNHPIGCEIPAGLVLRADKVIE